MEGRALKPQELGIGTRLRECGGYPRLPQRDKEKGRRERLSLAQTVEFEMLMRFPRGTTHLRAKEGG